MIPNATARELPQLFECLHDGSIARYEATPEQLTLLISCQYLAERVQPSFSTFRLRLHDLPHFRFLAWDDSVPAATVLTDIAQVFASELEVLSATFLPESSLVQVTCLQHNPVIAWSGGTQEIACRAFDLAAEASNRVHLPALRQIAQAYWANFYSPKKLT